MAEAAYRKIQIGKETTLGTEVEATRIFPADPGSGEFTLNRATQVPDEDYGRSVRNQSGRGSHGVKVATATLSAPARFEDVGFILNMALGSATSSGAGTVTTVWDRDTTAASINSYTVEADDGVAPFIATGVVATGFELSFDALGAGENSMWTISADLQAANVTQGTATGGLSDPTTLETMEGHLTTIAMGPTGTAFASLAAVGTALVSYAYRDTFEKPGRPYGGSETFSSVGAQKGIGEVTIMLKTTSATIDESWDIFTVSGALPTERRVRITVDGSGDNVFTIDHRLLFTDVHIEPDGRDGERLVSITAETMYDSTLASDVEMTLVSSTGTAF
jgi:hypothetical protein